MIEIRHYVNRGRKDVFDDWLTQLADARTQAKIATESIGLLSGTLATVSLCDRVYANYGSIGDRGTVSITR